MNNRIFVTLSTILLMTYSVHSQSIVGLWGVTKVSVGDRNMTPVAKWMKFQKDGTCMGGNGWTQNSAGTWSFNKKTQELVPTNELGTRDDFGPFKVSFSKDTMIWTRQEEGMTVVVSLAPISETPPAPADLVKGLWELSKAEDTNGDKLEGYDPEDQQFIFIRPDMRFRLRQPDASVTQGFWHMDGHRPILTLINYDRTIDNQEYEISFGKGLLIMKPSNEHGNVYYYSRIDEFPR